MKLYNTCFFYRDIAWFIWKTFFITFDIQLPSSVSNMFGSWLKGFSSKPRVQILVGVAALY